MIIIKNKLLKITIVLLILLMSIGIACASEKNKTDLSVEENTDNPLPIDELDNAINSTQDNGAVHLEKEYVLNENKTLKINKSLTFNGAENRSIIEGNGNYLNLDIIDEEPNVTEGELIIISLDDGLKKTGKHLIFNNITFKNIKLQTWHRMEFNDCEFINSTFISKEMDNEFNNCIFNSSIIAPDVVAGYNSNGIFRLSAFTNCLFFESDVMTKIRYPPNYIHVVGGDFFRVYDSIDLADCHFLKSEITVNNVYLNISRSTFNTTDMSCHSNAIIITDSKFSNQKTDLTICKSNFTNSTFNMSNINLQASYFSIGSQTDINGCSLNNSKIEISPGFRSRQSQIRIMDTDMDNSYLEATDTHVMIENSRLNNAEMSLCFSSLNITDSTISNNDSAENTITTKLQETREVWDDENYTNKTVYYQIKTDYTVSNTYFINESGKFQLNSEDISKDTLYNFTCTRQEVYFINNALVFKLLDKNGNPVAGEKIYVKIEDSYVYPVPSITTDENGTARYYLSEAGNLNINAYYYSPGFNFDNIMHSISFKISVKSPVDGLKVSKYNFKAVNYSNIKSYLKIELTSKDGKDLSNIKLTIKLKNKKYNAYSDSNGTVIFKIPKKLDAGTYNIKISVPHTKITKTIILKVNKAKATVNAPKLTAKFKKSKHFKITVKNRNTKKAISKVKIKIKVYTGGKYKTYTVKTNKKGIAKINTKNLKVGKHKVVISSANNNYRISAKSKIKIEK